MSEIIIVGAGITGPTAALALARNGHQVTVYEQRPENALFSNGIMGITQANWQWLTNTGVNLAPGELGNLYRDYELGTVRSPFRLIVWTDLHDYITNAARAAGARFVFNSPTINLDVLPDDLSVDYIIDAGGIVSAARRNLPHVYLGSIIYRGISTLDTPEDFTTYKLPHKRGFLDIGQTHQGGSWAFGIRRPQPKHFRTTFTTEIPPEVDELPEEFRRVIKATPEIMALPQAGWTVASTMHDEAWRRFTLGDANGPVRPITTSGANLAVQAGLTVNALLRDSETRVHDSEAHAASLLRRRAYAINLGLHLTGPEIGGELEDPNFYVNQAAMSYLT